MSLDRETLDVFVGSTATTLVATVTPANATNKSVTWSSSDTGVATVSAAGAVTPVAVGTATITVTTVSGSFTDTVAVTVAAVPATGVTLDMTTVTTHVGDAATTLVATVAPENASDKSVTWSSSNTAVATVSATGAVTAVGVGSATITVTTVSGGFTDTVAVTVAPVAVTGVVLNASTLPLIPGQTGQLMATVAPGNATNASVTWMSSNTAAATVSATGLVTAVAVGSATITVTTASGGFAATCAVTVTQPATGVSVTPTEQNLYVGGPTSTITATVTPAAASQVVTWSSNHPEFATVTTTGGVVTAVAIGDATITATTVGGGHSATSTVHVIAAPVTGVALNTPTLSKGVGDVASQLVATLSPSYATNTNVTWMSSNTAVATVSATGAVSAVATGTATITVTTVDGSFTATCEVTVTPSQTILARWDFNDTSLGAADGATVPDSDGNTVWRLAAYDTSGNGNHMTTWEAPWAGFNWSNSSVQGNLSIKSTGGYPAAFTWSAQSSPSGANLETFTGVAFTVEALATIADAGSYRTVVGRDARNLSLSDGNLAALYLGVLNNDHAVFRYTDVNGVTIEVQSTTTFAASDTVFHHFVGTTDGSTVSLYVDGVLLAQAVGQTLAGLGIGTVSAGDWHAGGWTVARGLYAGNHGDRWQGYIDAVAISNVARAPGSFVLGN